MEAVKSAAALAAEQQGAAKREDQSSAPASVGGLIGGFGRKMAQRKSESKDAGPKARAAFMTITNERLSVSTNVSTTDLAMPAGFREER